MALTISAILPTHDRPASLERCVDSLLAQHRLPEQLIVVNDGRQDLRPQLLERLAQAGWRLQFIRRDEASSTASRNAGLAAADGDIVVLLEDDLTLPAEFLQNLAAIYAADTHGLIGGIGPRICEPDTQSPGGRAWLAVAHLLGRGRWGPRRVASRYVTLPRDLAGTLTPVRKLSAGGLSLRREIARAFRFDEMLSGYAWGEDRELTFRIAPHHALYRAKHIEVLHHREPGGRGDWRGRGRAYVTNTLHILDAAGGGAGTVMLVAWDLATTVLQYLAWSLPSPRRGEKLEFVAGILVELQRRFIRAAWRCLCG